MITFKVRKTFLKKLRTLCNLVGFWLAGNRNGIQSTTNISCSSISLFRLFSGGWKFPVFCEKKNQTSVLVQNQYKYNVMYSGYISIAYLAQT